MKTLRILLVLAFFAFILFMAWPDLPDTPPVHGSATTTQGYYEKERREDERQLERVEAMKYHYRKLYNKL